MSRPRVLCDEAVPEPAVRAALADADVAVSSPEPPWSGNDVVGALVFSSAFGAGELERLPALLVVATPSVGFDHIDVAAATRRGVWVCNVPDYCVEEVADSALALVLALVRGVVELDRSVREGRWDHGAAGPLRKLGDLRLGVVGFGRIGRALAARATALGIAVVATDPLVAPAEIAVTGAQPASLEELLSACNVVSLHLPLTPETEGLLGERELALLPLGSYLVNVARAALVDEGALLAALASGRLAGAALDVLPIEPPTPEAPAPQAARLVVTPHAAWYSAEAEESASRRAALAVRDVLEGRRPAGAVNEPAGSRRRTR